MKNTTLSQIVLGSFLVVGFAAQAWAGTAAIDASTKYQRISGFGASTAWGYSMTAAEATALWIQRLVLVYRCIVFALIRRVIARVRPILREWPLPAEPRSGRLHGLLLQPIRRTTTRQWAACRTKVPMRLTW